MERLQKATAPVVTVDAETSEDEHPTTVFEWFRDTFKRPSYNSQIEVEINDEMAWAYDIESDPQSELLDSVPSGNCFKSDVIASRFINVFATMLALRQQGGIVPDAWRTASGTSSRTSKDYWIIVLDTNGHVTAVSTSAALDLGYKTAGSLSPLYESQEAAHNAIDLVGASNIKYSILTLAGNHDLVSRLLEAGTYTLVSHNS